MSIRVMATSAAPGKLSASQGSAVCAIHGNQWANQGAAESVIHDPRLSDMSCSRQVGMKPISESERSVRR